MCRFVLWVMFFCVSVFADSLSVAPSAKAPAPQQSPLPAAVTDSLIATMPLVPPDPYAELEQIAPAHFQDMVVRQQRLKAISEDMSQPKNVRAFARAAQFFYKEQWDSSYAAYDSLRGRDTLLDGAVILRMATAKFKLGEYQQMRSALLTMMLLLTGPRRA